ncbi:glutathione peroxidase [Permianibacter aggregans]|uniref:Glutathione peroxidase n=1 Tax=Permianibacter aggregans TaxID=1510150 RepID=A0A4V3D8B0_9GAMM|nr:glutathione peroxidase [Permianibacter aggregans]QGX41293.1 glutathione peroxidase [Permianibacter aggregans]TDQ51077.1 glutathione peroxidase [Permianibacter aggregans]
MTSVHDYSAQLINGQEQSLEAHKGKVLLIVNVASKCGYTPQYEGLEALYRQYKDQGFEVLGFPCNQFLSQEPGDEQQIAQFCSTTYDVTFPMYRKIDVNGDNAHPLYRHLKSEAKGILGSEAIKWNFTKFLVGRDGKVIERYATATKPEELKADIEKALAQ